MKHLISPNNIRQPHTTYFVYIVSCADDTLYTGITTEVERRIQEHNNTVRGAKYTHARRPVSLVYQEGCESRSAALKKEAEIKRMTRMAKLDLIAQCDILTS
jgi:putative endonuclease